MDLLPKWRLTKSLPASRDSESSTCIEMTYKLYKAMQNLISEYTTFSSEVSATLSENEEKFNQDLEIYATSLRQEFQDFVDIVDLKISSFADDEEIMVLQSSVSDLTKSIENVRKDLQAQIDNVDSVINSINSSISSLTSELSNAKSRISSLETRVSSVESRVSTLENNSGSGDTTDLEKRLGDVEGENISQATAITNLQNTKANKSELFSKNYNDLTNKPTIPTKVSQLTNDSGFLTQHQSLSDYAKKTELPTKTSQLTNDSGFLTQHQDISGKAEKTEVNALTTRLTSVETRVTTLENNPGSGSGVTSGTGGSSIHYNDFVEIIIDATTLEQSPIIELTQDTMLAISNIEMDGIEIDLKGHKLILTDVCGLQIDYTKEIYLILHRNMNEEYEGYINLVFNRTKELYVSEYGQGFLYFETETGKLCRKLIYNENDCWYVEDIIVGEI